MPYQQGPLLLQDAGNVGVATSDYNFAGDVADQLGDLETIPAGWDSFLQDATLLMSEPSDPFPDVDLGAAMQTLHAYSDPESFLGLSAMVSALGDADIALGTAIGFAPAEAWMDSGTPFVAPVPAEVLSIPAIPTDSFTFNVSGTVAAGSQPPVIPSGGIAGAGTGSGSGAGGTPGISPQTTTTTVSLLNTSQYGSPNFRVGDQFQVTVIGPAGAQVAVGAQLDDADLGVSVEGSIPTNGQLVIQGTMDENSVGMWAQQWYVDGSIIQTFSFLVVGA